ncbi:hypothetical protein MTO96_020170 [Rhipicephalus appendiculatus]
MEHRGRCCQDIPGIRHDLYVDDIRSSTRILYKKSFYPLDCTPLNDPTSSGLARLQNICRNRARIPRIHSCMRPTFQSTVEM